MENEIKKIDKNGEKKCLKISYKLIFIETARFIASSLSNLANNLSKHFHKLNVNMDLMIKNMKFRNKIQNFEC